MRNRSCLSEPQDQGAVCSLTLGSRKKERTNSIHQRRNTALDSQIEKDNLDHLYVSPQRGWCLVGMQLLREWESVSTFQSLDLGVLEGRKAWEVAEIWNGILTQMGVRNLFPSLFLFLRESLVHCLGWKITTRWMKEGSSGMINNTLQMWLQSTASEWALLPPHSHLGGRSRVPTRLQWHKFCNSSFGIVFSVWDSVFECPYWWQIFILCLWESVKK